MFSSKNIQMNERKNRSKVTRYAIKKLSMGTASVAVALGFMFVQGLSLIHICDGNYIDLVGSYMQQKLEQ